MAGSYWGHANDIWATAFCILVWVGRFLVDRPACFVDLKISAALVLCFHLDVVFSTVHFVWNSLCTSRTNQYSIAALFTVIACFFVASNDGSSTTTTRATEDDTASEIWPRPLIFPSRTSHTRMFPRKHSFSYSYLMVGIPIGWRGSVASMVSADVPLPGTDTGRGKQRKVWLSVDAADHLDRGSAHLGLKGKLHTYLNSQVRSLKIGCRCACSQRGRGNLRMSIHMCIW